MKPANATVVMIMRKVAISVARGEKLLYGSDCGERPACRRVAKVSPVKSKYFAQIVIRRSCESDDSGERETEQVCGHGRFWIQY